MSPPRDGRQCAESRAARRAVPVTVQVIDRRRVAGGVADREVAIERSGAAAGERHEHHMLRARERRDPPQRIRVAE
jgi:hypothetical protein